jgi:hypothetical protein
VDTHQVMKITMENCDAHAGLHVHVAQGVEVRHSGTPYRITGGVWTSRKLAHGRIVGIWDKWKSQFKLLSASI